MSPYYFYKITLCEDTLAVVIKDMNDESFEKTVKLTPMDFLNLKLPPYAERSEK
ncbi:MAG: hypothetical protein SV062_07390 [Thermodesulfobacteriota bacterium]|nr:hypothetical protein [Thermodesulfobacteriota bacterium]